MNELPCSAPYLLDMFLLLYLVLAYFNQGNGVWATPIVTQSGILPSQLFPASNDPLSLFEAQCLCRATRSTLDIVWGCLATIFACSWVSMHPNIPALNEGSIRSGMRRIELMLWLLIAPEVIIFWAANQWIGARAVAEQYKDRGWTRVHGYFIQMGGLMLYEGDTPKGVLLLPKFEELLERDEIDFPTILEEDIKDRSKGDGLAKLLVLVQTTWFIIQCIARHIQNLHVTQLELLTAALAVLNGFMYWFWWNKPLNIGRGVPVYMKSDRKKPRKIVTDAAIQTDSVMDTDTSLSSSHRDEAPHTPQESKDEAILSPCLKPINFTPELNEKFAAKTAHPIEIRIDRSNAHMNPLHQKSKFTKEHFVNLAPKTGRYLWIFIAPIVYVLEAVSGTIFPPEDGEMSVPMLYASQHMEALFPSPPLQLCFAIFIAAVFGGIHCVGWSIVFPSIPERTLWRISSAVITAYPGLFGIVMITVEAVERTLISISPKLKQRREEYYELRWQRRRQYLDTHNLDKSPVLDPSDLAVTCILAPYFIARLCLMVVAFTSLRKLPASSYDVVEWTTFIPHI